MRTIMMAAGALLLASCGNGTPPPQPEQVPAKLPAGEWEVTAKVTSVDGKAASQATAKVGEVVTSRACVGADGVVPVALFAAKGDTCEAQSPYVRNGRVNMQMTCKREGTHHSIMADVSGTYTAEAIKGDGKVTTYVGGMDSYQVKQELSGRLVGACTATKA